MRAAIAELLPLALAALGGVMAGFWPGWTACAWHAQHLADSLRFGQLDGEEEHAAAWDAEFSAAPVVAPRGRHSAGYRAHQHHPGAACWCGWPWPLAELPALVPDDEMAPPCHNCGSRIAYACLAGCPGRAAPGEHGERAATVGEIAATAEYQLAWGEVYGMMSSAGDWYERTFETGQFRKIEP